jgi:3',5'-cyclic AMP phosphodiesterase CpdA
MKSLSTAAYLLGLVFVFVCTSCSTIKPIHFVQITDPQLGFYPEKMEIEQQDFRKGIAVSNQLKPDFVVITGDLVNEPRDTNQLAAFQSISKELHATIPLWLLPGNHDVGNKPKPADLQFYLDRYGYDRFSFVYKKVRFIGINSNLIYAQTPESEAAQFAWLEQELQKGQKERGIILFSHHPFFLKEAAEADDVYFNITQKVRKRYLDLFHKYGVQAIFAGHYHRNSFGTHHQLQMITTASVTEPFHPDFKGIRLITINPIKNKDGKRLELKHRYEPITNVSTTFP